MFGLSKNKESPVLLVHKDLDSPKAGLTIARPELEVRGWLAFDKPFDLSNLKVQLEAGNLSLPIALEPRPDVSNGLTGEYCTGFNTLFDVNADLSSKNADWSEDVQIIASWPGGRASFPIDVELEENLASAESYFQKHDALLPDALVDAQTHKNWQDDGFLVLNEFYSAEETDKLQGLIEAAWVDRSNYSSLVTVDQHIGTDLEQRIPFADADPVLRTTSYKLNDLHLESPPLREYLLSERLRDALLPLIGGTPMICNSLSFERGSQQQDHFDTFFMPPLTRNQMLASWIALEDVHPDAGPLRYYPGSHKIPPFRFSHGRYNLNLDERPQCTEYIERQLAETGIQPVEFYAKKGDIFIWHAHLLHGGSPIHDPTLTRKSLVTHYFCCEDWSEDYYQEDRPGYFFLKKS
jgi:phytanoyl-CoA hydroxylase